MTRLLTILACLSLLLVLELDATTTWALTATSSKLVVAAALLVAAALVRKEADVGIPM